MTDSEANCHALSPESGGAGDEPLFSRFGPDFVPAFAERNVPVFLSCDGNFFAHTITVAASILENGAPENNYDICLAVDGVQTADLQAAAQWARRYVNCRLRYIDAGAFLSPSGRNAFYVTENFALPTYFRFFAPSLFEKYDKIIYLDSDVVVLADIAELYRRDLGESFLAAAHDYAIEDDLKDAWKKEAGGIGRAAGAPYFNAGVLLLNLRKMREERVEERLLEAVRRTRGPVALVDQDILNEVCRGRAEFLEPGWNMFAWMLETEATSVMLRFAGAEIQNLCREHRGDCRILHYIGSKPWNFEYVGAQAEYYWRCSRLTPFYQKTAENLRRQRSFPAQLKFFARRAFHLARCGLYYPFGGPARRKKYARRLFSYWLDLKALFRPKKYKR